MIHIRKIKAHLHAYEAKLSKSRAKKTVTAFVSKLSTIEEALYQVSNQSNQDPLNFPIKLNNRLASLRRSVENGDAKPTDGAYKVFKELSAELETHLGRLNGTLEKDLPKVNALLEANGIDTISR